MNFNFFNLKKKESPQAKEKFDESGFTKSQLAEYDKRVKFYYTNIINSLVLFTYNSEKLDKMSPILIDPLTELYEELELAFTPVCFETVFRNNFIETKFKEELLKFRNEAEEIPNEIWDWKFLDDHKKWKEIRAKAENILTNIGINHRDYDHEYTTIILSSKK